jgi:hypothetical protein
VLEHETYWPTIHKAKLQELRTRISKNPKLFNSIAMQYFAQNQPIEMRNLLRHILSLKSMEALRSMNLLVVKKNLALIELSQLQTDFYGFSRALAKYKDLFASENDKHEPTFNVKDLENFIDKAHELFNRIAIFYFEEGKPEWMKNLFQYILSQKRVNELVDTNPLVFQKNLALIELQSKLYLTDFESELLKLKNLFAKENKAFKPTVNTKKLKAEIDGKPTFFDNIAKAYYAQGKPEWMKDALPYILSEPRMVEMLGSKVIRHTSGLNKVFNRNDIWSIVDSYLMIKTASVSSKRKYDDAFH